MTSLRHLRSSTANKRPDPTAMVDGQLAMNYDIASPGLFFKDDNGTLIKVGPVHVGTTAPNVSPAAGGTAGNSIGEQWLDTTSGVYVLKVWDGSAWRSESGTFVDVSGDTMTGALTMANQQAVRFSETTANGSNYIALQADAALASNKTITLPDTTGTVVTTGDTGTVTSTMIANDTILNADVNASAAIAGTKVSPDFGSQTIATTGILSTGTGTAAAPSIAFTGDTNTGIYSPGADQLAVSTGGTGRLFVDASGRVGIGTSSPTAGYLLDCRGNVKFGSPSTAGVYLGVDSNIPFIQGFDSGATYNQLKFLVGATEAARIDSSGRLLVGTSSARGNFFNTTVSPGFQLEGTSTTNSSNRFASVVFGDGGAPGPIIALGKHRSSSIGGTTVVASGDEIGQISFQGSDGTEFVEGANIQAFVDGTPGANDMPGRLVFSTTADGAASPTERMRIDNAGQVFIGCTGLTNDAPNTAGGTIKQTNGNTKVRVTGDGTPGFQFYSPTGGTGSPVGSIFVNASSTSYSTSSDYRLKENVTPVSDGITRLQQLKPNCFNFIADPDKTVDGFIAHEVQAVVPEAVHGTKDEVNADGNPIYQGIDQSKLVPLLTAALQEAIARIETLEAAVAALQGA